MVDWQRITREHGPLVWGTAYRILANHQDAADCFQETFMSALKIASVNDVKSWPAMLQHLATARALDALRRRRRQGASQDPVADWNAVAANAPGPDRRLEDAELAASLRHAVAQLPPQQAEIFCLRHFNDLSYDEIASEAGVSVDAVGVQLHRARARLRELLSTEVKHGCS